MSEYVPVEYPRWIYHATEPAQVVDTPEAHAAAGDGWHTAPVPQAEPGGIVGPAGSTPQLEHGGIVGELEKVAKKVGKGAKKAAGAAGEVAEAAAGAALSNLGAFQE